MKLRYKLIIILLVSIIGAGSYFLLTNLVKDKKENDEFKELENEIIVQDKTDEILNQNLTNENEQKENQNDNIVNYSTIDLKSLKSQNKDLIGWIKIDSTSISYPVMQNGDFYLRKNFYKNYSKLGTPYLASYCDVNKSDILTIYGHNINQGYMFADLIKYQNYNYYQNHKYIKFYTLQDGYTQESMYEICFVIKTNADNYKYYSYTNFYSENDLKEFIENCQKLSLYDTEVKGNYGDKFIVLSTCEYSQDNGRMIVIGKKR